MTASTHTIEIESEARPTFADITESIQTAVNASSVLNGIALIMSPHTTCSVLVQESSHDTDYFGTEFLMRDLVTALEKIVPTATSETQYRHPGPKHIEWAQERGEKAWWSLNVDAHLRSVLLGRSATIAIDKGALVLGDFSRVFFADFDQIRARKRRCVVSILGE